MRWYWSVLISLPLWLNAQQKVEQTRLKESGFYAQMGVGPSIPITRKSGWSGPMNTGFTSGFSSGPLKIMADYNHWWGVSFSLHQFYHRYHNSRINSILKDFGFEEYSERGRINYLVLQTGIYIHVVRTDPVNFTWAINGGIGQLEGTRLHIFRQRPHDAHFQQDFGALEVMSYTYYPESSRDYFVSTSITCYRQFGDGIRGFLGAELGLVPDFYGVESELIGGRTLKYDLPFDDRNSDGMYPYVNFQFGLQYRIHRKT